MEGMRKLLDDEGGQAVVEYVLATMVALSVVSIISISFRRSIFALWNVFSRDISAACPGCPPDASVRIR